MDEPLSTPQDMMQKLLEAERRVAALEQAIDELHRVYSMSAGGVRMHDAMMKTIALVRNET